MLVAGCDVHSAVCDMPGPVAGSAKSRSGMDGCYYLLSIQVLQSFGFLSSMAVFNDLSRSLQSDIGNAKGMEMVYNGMNESRNRGSSLSFDS